MTTLSPPPPLAASANDAPALKQANIGVAMGITGTDVSKETADMVLTDDNYVSIVSAVEQGRIIYDNIRKFVAFLLTCNLAEIRVIFLAVLVGAPSPLTAIQLLWLNLLTDGAPALALGVEKGDPDIMNRPPRPPNEPIIDRVIRINLIVQTIFKTAVTLFAFFYIYNPSLTGHEAELYEGMRVRGWPMATLVRGRVVVRQAQLLADMGWGEYVPRHLMPQTASKKETAT